MTTETMALALALPGIAVTIDTNAVVDQMVRRASSMGSNRGGGARNPLASAPTPFNSRVQTSSAAIG